jgi:DNA-binding MarR family transcriptional regulator/N-acetylglutamate synthase-like GNAT family acetyltransferase
MDFFNRVGKLALGSRMRILTERMVTDASRIYEMYNVELNPKWFPVFYILSEDGDKAITEIAREIGHSHASVSKIISEMSKNGIVTEKKDKADARRTVASLSKKGKEISVKIQDQYIDINSAVDELSSQATYDLWKALAEWEYLLEQKSLFERVQDHRKRRESLKVEIVDYKPAYRKAFRDMNEEWISRYFKMEAADYKALDNPKGYILDKGGFILVAMYNGEPAGVCALVKMDDPMFDFELAKMAVSPKFQGHHIGYKLGLAAIEKAKAEGASRIYLESNTLLKPAIRLYDKLGFVKLTGRPSPYERCNIQMELAIKEQPSKLAGAKVKTRRS